MQCPSCRAVYSNGLDTCPRCKTAASKLVVDSDVAPPSGTEAKIDTTPSATVTAKAKAAPANTPTPSTLIEFPGTARASRPQWRKDLSARVREIQERRSREAEEAVHRHIEEPLTITIDESAHQLGLVPNTNAPVVNPIVAAALKRLERARQPSPRSLSRTSVSGGAATAVARVAEEQFETETKHTHSPTAVDTAPAVPPAPEQVAPANATRKTEPRAHQLAVVATPSTPKTIPRTTTSPQPKRVSSELVKPTLTEPAVLETPEATPLEEYYDDRAPVLSRIAGGLLDLVVVAFASSPFAAIIELTNGNWADWRVLASMGGIVLVVMFLYLTASTALAGRTWGMSLVSLRAVDADTGLPPTTRQSVGRAILYILSLITLGLGLIYALIDAEARTLHDYFSGTAVVRE